MILDPPWRTVTGTVVDGYAVRAARLEPGPAGYFTPANQTEFDQTLLTRRPRWELDVTVEADETVPGASGALRAFAAQLATEAARFRHGDPRRHRPQTWPTGTARPWLANPAVEAAVVGAVARDATVLPVGGLTVGATFLAGDVISYVWQGEYRLAMLTAPATVPSGGVVNLSITPRTRALPSGALVQLSGATGVFTAVRGETRITLEAGPRGVVLQITGALECQ